jgi:hypothetical protein
MALTVKPAFGANVSSKDWEKYFGKWLPNGVFDGFQVTAGSGLNINISAGTGHINGYFIESDTTESRSVNASATNRVWCRLTRDSNGFVTGWNFVITTTATPPTDSVLIATVVTSSSAITSITDERNSGMAGIILEKSPSTSNAKPHLRIVDVNTTSPRLQLVRADGTFISPILNLISTTTFISSGTYTTPSGTKMLLVDMCGGGGGGASGISTTAGAGGGGAPRVMIQIWNPSSSYSVTIGGGGSGGAGGSAGSMGGTSYFGSFGAVGGGNGGWSGSQPLSGLSINQNVWNPSQFLPSSFAFISIEASGNGGGNLIRQSAWGFSAGTNSNGGGAGPFGSGGAGSITSNVAGSSASANSGAGGGGGGANAAGGSGGSGRVVVYAYG